MSGTLLHRRVARTVLLLLGLLAGARARAEESTVDRDASGFPDFSVADSVVGRDYHHTELPAFMVRLFPDQPVVTFAVAIRGGFRAGGLRQAEAIEAWWRTPVVGTTTTGEVLKQAGVHSRVRVFPDATLLSFAGPDTAAECLMSLELARRSTSLPGPSGPRRAEFIEEMLRGGPGSLLAPLYESLFPAGSAYASMGDEQAPGLTRRGDGEAEIVLAGNVDVAAIVELAAASVPPSQVCPYGPHTPPATHAVADTRSALLVRLGSSGIKPSTPPDLPVPEGDQGALLLAWRIGADVPPLTIAVRGALDELAERATALLRAKMSWNGGADPDHSGCVAFKGMDARAVTCWVAARAGPTPPRPLRQWPGPLGVLEETKRRYRWRCHERTTTQFWSAGRSSLLLHGDAPLAVFQRLLTPDTWGGAATERIANVCPDVETRGALGAMLDRPPDVSVWVRRVPPEVRMPAWTFF